MTVRRIATVFTSACFLAGCMPSGISNRVISERSFDYKEHGATIVLRTHRFSVHGSPTGASFHYSFQATNHGMLPICVELIPTRGYINQPSPLVAPGQTKVVGELRPRYPDTWDEATTFGTNTNPRISHPVTSIDGSPLCGLSTNS